MSQNVYQVVFDRLIEQLEDAGTWKKGWTWVSNGLPRNYVTGRQYTGFNVFMLMFQNRGSPYWLTHAQAKTAGGAIREGEKSTPLLMPILKKVPATDKEGKPIILPDGKELMKEVLTGFRYYKVWNWEQTEGVPEKKVDAKDHEMLPAPEGILAGVMPHIKLTQGNPAYSPARDTVMMPPAGCFGEVEEYYASFFHELVHWTGHKDRLNRPGLENVRFGSETYSKEELVAELGALFLAGFTGIDGKTADNAAAYIKSWLTHLKDHPKELVEAASAAYKGARFILDLGGKKSPAAPTPTFAAGATA